MTTLLAFKIIAHVHMPQWAVIREFWKEAFADTPIPKKDDGDMTIIWRKEFPNYDPTDYLEAVNILQTSACEYLTRELDGKAKKPNRLGS